MSNNAPQASPTIQELLDEIFKEQWPEIEDVNGFSNTKRQICTIFSRIITKARPEKKHYGDTCTPKHCFCMYTPRNDAIDEYERNLRVAISKEIKK